MTNCHTFKIGTTLELLYTTNKLKIEYYVLHN